MEALTPISLITFSLRLKSRTSSVDLFTISTVTYAFLPGFFDQIKALSSKSLEALNNVFEAYSRGKSICG